LVEALDTVVRKLGGVTRDWQFDRMATVCDPPSGRLTAAFSQVAKHYGVRSVVFPPRRGNRKGVVEKANHSAAQRWWCTLADDATIAQAQAGADRLAAAPDGRRHMADDEATTVAALAEAEPLRPPPLAASPVELEVARTVSPQGLGLPFAATPIRSARPARHRGSRSPSPAHRPPVGRDRRWCGGGDRRPRSHQFVVQHGDLPNVDEPHGRDQEITPWLGPIGSRPRLATSVVRSRETSVSYVLLIAFRLFVCTMDLSPSFW
jgi:hypothetical protein